MNQFKMNEKQMKFLIYFFARQATLIFYGNLSNHNYNVVFGMHGRYITVNAHDSNRLESSKKKTASILFH